MLFGLSNRGGAGRGLVPLTSAIMPTDGLIGLDRPFIQGQAAVPGLNPAVEPAASPAPMPATQTARLTPEQLALREKANAAWRPDYSPVQSWTQGLARVADAWVHTSEQRRLEKEAAAINTDRTNSIAAFLARDSPSSPSSHSPVAAALASSDPTLQKLGMWRLEQDNPKPTQPHYWELNNGSLFAIGPDGQPREMYHDPTPKMNFIPDGMGGGQWVAVPSQLPADGSELAPGAPAIGAVVADPRGNGGGGAGNSVGGFR